MRASCYSRSTQRTVVGLRGHDRANNRGSDNDKLETEHVGEEELFKSCWVVEMKRYRAEWMLGREEVSWWGASRGEATNNAYERGWQLLRLTTPAFLSFAVAMAPAVKVRNDNVLEGEESMPFQLPQEEYSLT